MEICPIANISPTQMGAWIQCIRHAFTAISHIFHAKSSLGHKTTSITVLQPVVNVAGPPNLITIRACTRKTF